jgi:hypothetical protein
MKDRTISTQGRARKTVVRLRKEAAGKPDREIRIPELYRTPTPDRDFQGCMKARA